MHQHHEVRVAACPDYVWAVLTDVGRWPQWAPALHEVVPFDGGPLVVGGGVRVRARHLPARQWCVTDVRPHRGFSWSGTGVGSAARFDVGIEPGPGSRTVVRFTLRRSGWVASLVGGLTGTTTAAHLEELADGLRRRCEAGQGRVPARAPAQVPGVG